MNKKTRKIMMCILLAVFLVSTALALRQWQDNADGETTYQSALDIAASSKKEEAPVQKQTEPVATPTEAEKELLSYWIPAAVENDPVMEEMAAINLDALRETNEDVLGWIRIPNTRIDYPLLQGEDNDYYLKFTCDKQYNSVGSIFLEHTNSPDLTDFNTIVYGHNMRDGSMFADLRVYSLQEYWEAQPYVYIVTDAGVYRYEIFAFLSADVDSLTYGTNPNRDDTKEKFLDLSLENSWLDTGIRPAITDRILTLSTCTGFGYSSRFVVQARLPMVEVTE